MPRAMAALLFLSSPLVAEAERGAGRILEIRSYDLKPDTRERFHRLFVSEILPMLQRWDVDVVAYGPSIHDEESYYLMRSFASLEDREERETAFYGSDEWRKGPREAVLADIESYVTTVIAVDGPTLQGLRAKEELMSASDRTQLLELNREYIRSVQESDVARFREILADDFLCSLPDGSLLDRDRFLEETAKPVAITDLEAHDVNVRLMGDFAIIHARTTYRTKDGSPGSGRYTDVWVRREGRWLAVSAHVTRN